MSKFVFTSFHVSNSAKILRSIIEAGWCAPFLFTYDDDDNAEFLCIYKQTCDGFGTRDAIHTSNYIDEYITGVHRSIGRCEFRFTCLRPVLRFLYH